MKAPQQIDFTHELPRHPNGKLYKRRLRDAYWGKTVKDRMRKPIVIRG